MELFSFGSFASLYLFCADRWGDSAMRDEHYMLRQAQFVRNACAHSSNMVNGFADQSSNVGTNANGRKSARQGQHLAPRQDLKDAQPPAQADSHASVPALAPGSCRVRPARAINDMAELQRSAKSILALLPNNDKVQSSLGFLSKLIDSWF